MKPLDRYVDPLNRSAPRRLSAMPGQFHSPDIKIRKRPGSLGSNLAHASSVNTSPMPRSVAPEVHDLFAPKGREMRSNSFAVENNSVSAAISEAAPTPSHKQKDTLVVNDNYHHNAPSGMSGVNAPSILVQGSERDLNPMIHRTETEFISAKVEQRNKYNQENKDMNRNLPSYKENPNKLPFGVKDSRLSTVIRAARVMRKQQSHHQRVGTFGRSEIDLNRYQQEDEDEAPVGNETDLTVNEQIHVMPRMASFDNNYLRKSQQEVYGGNEPSGVMSSEDDPPGPAYSAHANVAIPAADPGFYNAVPDGSVAEIAPGTAINNNNNRNIPPPASSSKYAKMNDASAVTMLQSSVIPIGNLSSFLGDKSLLRMFLKFLKKKTQDYKLLEFYLMAGQFKEYAMDPNSTNNAQRNNAKLIIETFFLPDSKKFLEKVQGITRHEAMSQFLNAPKEEILDITLFDRSRLEVKQELVSRVFPIFMQSDRYRKLVDSGKIRPP